MLQKAQCLGAYFIVLRLKLMNAFDLDEVRCAIALHRLDGQQSIVISGQKFAMKVSSVEHCGCKRVNCSIG